VTHFRFALDQSQPNVICSVKLFFSQHFHFIQPIIFISLLAIFLSKTITTHVILLLRPEQLQALQYQH
jgi:hypothetical protein